jgi:transcriptional regulator with GAF, ATPase, and Fis domain
MAETLKTIKSYRILRQIEESNYAVVYRAESPDGKPVIIKCARDPQPEYNELIAREFQILSQVKHPNIVAVEDFDVRDDKSAFFVMEYVPGTALNRHFSGFSEDFAAALIQVLSGLAAFHNRGFVHTDLKPEHILYDPTRKKIVIIDFGFAGRSKHDLTPAGTFGYIAPEVLKGLNPDQRSDLYSLGVIIKEILASPEKPALAVPFPGMPAEIDALFRRLQADEPALRPSLPELYRALSLGAGREPDQPFSYRVDLPTTVFIEPRPIIEAALAENAQTVVIYGAAGAGRTRLLKEIKFRLQRQNHAVFYYRAAEKIGLWEALGNFIGYPGPAGADQFTACEELCQALIRTGRDRKTAIIIDDLDKLGANDFALVQYLAIGLRSSGIRLIATLQDQKKIPAADGPTFALEPLDPSRVLELIERTFSPIDARESEQSPVPLAEFTDWLHSQSGGNPLYIEETLKFLHAEKILEYGAAGWRVRRDLLRRIKIPSRIEEILNGLWQRLADDDRALLRVLAVMDCPAEPSVLNRVFSSPLNDRLENLKRLGLLREEFEGSRRTVLPANKFIPALAIAGLDSAERRRWNQAILDALASIDNGHELYFPLRARLCHDLGQKREALHFYQAAGAHAEKFYDRKSALDAYDQAARLSHEIDPDNYYKLLLKIAGLCEILGLTDRSIAAYREAIEQGPAGLRPTALAELGRLLNARGEYNQVAEYLNQALALMDEKDPIYNRTANSLGSALMNTGRLIQAGEIFDATLARAQAARDRIEEAATRYNQATLAWFRNELDQAIALARTGLEFCARHELTLDHAYFANLLTTCHLSQSNLTAAREYIDLAIDGFSKTRHVELMNAALQNKAALLISSGELKAGEEILRVTLDRARQTENLESQYYALFNLGWVFEFLGQFPGALEYYHQAQAIRPNYDQPAIRSALVRYKQGDLDEARRMLEDNNRTREDPDNYLGLALINAERADWEKAQAHLDRAKSLLGDNPVSTANLSFLTAATQYYMVKGDFINALYYAEKLKIASRDERFESTIAKALIKINQFALGQTGTLDLTLEVESLASMGYLYDFAVINNFAAEAVYFRYPAGYWPQILQYLAAAEKTFAALACRAELSRLQKFKARLFPDLAAEFANRALAGSYLETFSRIAELIGRDLGEEDFPEQILDAVIAATGAERGAIFIKKNKGMELVAGRGMDQTTLRDASSLSQSALAKLGRAEIVFAENALANPDFSLKKSVVLNQIRSLLCMPLVVNDSVMGAIYLDSRIPDRLFGPRDRDFLQAVSRILAAVLEKSIAFGETQEENIILKSNLIREIGSGYLVGRSRAMKKVYQSVEDTAPTDLPVLILGETGTGKGMIARLIHLKSRRRNRKFLAINCGTIAETILESELFGHKKGSFTGAVSDKRGLLEEAEGGTVFLDEITNTSPAFQAKLLEAIEEKTIRRVGETVTRTIDVRFLFATNKDLEIEIEEGRFRKDLFYRINVFEVEIPPLRERHTDIPQLAHLFLERFSREINKKIDGFTADAVERLKANYWPGNVRELQNVIERSVIQARGRYIMAEDLSGRSKAGTDNKTIQEIKKELIVEELQAAEWNVLKAARKLGINRRTIQRYIKQYKIQK